MTKVTLPTPELLRKLLRYEPDTGELFWRGRTPDMFEDTARSAEWKCNSFNSAFSGKMALGCTSRNGYKSGNIWGRPYSAHRVIWAMVHGEWPNQIDHINHDILDNRIQNLRNVKIRDNNKNRTMQANNKTGVCGVSWGKKERRWKAQIGIDGVTTLLGCYKDFDEAVNVRKAAEKKHGFHINHGEAK